ncbi:MAG: nucleotide exchange factor GrpE [Planctomycetota bacterium]
MEAEPNVDQVGAPDQVDAPESGEPAPDAASEPVAGEAGSKDEAPEDPGEVYRVALARYLENDAEGALTIVAQALARPGVDDAVRDKLERLQRRAAGHIKKETARVKRLQQPEGTPEAAEAASEVAAPEVVGSPVGSPEATAPKAEKSDEVATSDEAATDEVASNEAATETTDEATTDEATTDEATTDEATTETSDEATTDEATTDEATTDEATTDEATTDEATTDEATTDEATTDEVASDDASSDDASSDGEPLEGGDGGTDDSSEVATAVNGAAAPPRGAARPGGPRPSGPPRPRKPGEPGTRRPGSAPPAPPGARPRPASAAPAARRGPPSGAVPGREMERLRGEMETISKAMRSVQDQTVKVAEAYQRLSRSGVRKEQAYDQLYEELRQYKDDFLLKAQKPLFKEVILLFDGVRQMLRNIEEREEPLKKEEVLDSLKHIRDEILEVLYRRDIELIEDYPDVLDIEIQKPIRRVETDDPQQDRRIEQVVREGFRMNGAVLRPQEVVVKRCLKEKES